MGNAAHATIITSDREEFGPSPRLVLLTRARRNVGLWIGGSVVVFICLFAAIGPLLIPHDPYDGELVNRLLPPVWYEGGRVEHLLGTDQLGRDILARLAEGARISLSIGLFVTVIACVIGVFLGMVAGYFAGWVDRMIMFFITVRLALPVILVALAVVSLIGSSFQTLIFLLGFLLWDRFALVTRAATQQNLQFDYVLAARAQGASTLWILFREILPNIRDSIIVVATLEVAQAIILESALSFLGMGVQAPLPSWGLMISEAREYILFDSWLIVIPGVALFFLVLGMNLLGDSIRDVTAPEGRR